MRIETFLFLTNLDKKCKVSFHSIFTGYKSYQLKQKHKTVKVESFCELFT